MRGRDNKRPNASGRNDRRTGSDGAFLMLRRSFWESPQVSALSCTARALLVELTAMYSGPKSNGRLFLSVRDAAARLGLSDHKAASAAINELVDVGLMSVALNGHFAMKAGGASRARAFRLHWKDDHGKPTSAERLRELDYRRLTAKQKRRVEMRAVALSAYRKEKFAVEESSTLTTVRADLATFSVEESTTLKSGNGGNLPKARVEESSTHIYYQGGSGAQQSKAPFTARAQKRPRNLKTAMARRYRPGSKRTLLRPRLQFHRQRVLAALHDERPSHA